VSNEIEITVNGWVAQHPRLVEKPGGTRVLKLRVGSTPRRRDPLTGAWGDGPTQWFTVVAFRDLAANACLSLHKGDPVLVRGRLALAQWEHEGRTYTSNEITADAIGHDLARGTALFARTVRRAVPVGAPGAEDRLPEEAPGDRTASVGWEDREEAWAGEDGYPAEPGPGADGEEYADAVRRFVEVGEPAATGSEPPGPERSAERTASGASTAA
jgi:single-strand DNA-binding protein